MAPPAVFDRCREPLDPNVDTQGLGLTAVLSMSVSDGKPELLWLRPTYCSVSRAMALTAQAGGAALLF